MTGVCSRRAAKAHIRTGIGRCLDIKISVVGSSVACPETRGGTLGLAGAQGEIVVGTAVIYAIFEGHASAESVTDIHALSDSFRKIRSSNVCPRYTLQSIELVVHTRVFSSIAAITQLLARTPLTGARHLILSWITTLASDLVRGAV